MASKKTTSTKRSRRASQPNNATPKRTRRKQAPRPVIKGELPEPIATFVF